MEASKDRESGLLAKRKKVLASRGGRDMKKAGGTQRQAGASRKRNFRKNEKRGTDGEIRQKKGCR